MFWEETEREHRMKKILIILLMVLVVLSGCGTKRFAKGPSDVVYILASKEVKESLQTAIDTTFSFGIRTPEFQRYFSTDWRPLNEMSEYIYFPCTIIIADLNKNDAASHFVKGLLSEERLESIKKDTVAMFALPDTWRRLQMLVMVAGYDMEKLSSFVMERQGWLFNKFNQQYIERQSKYIFNQYEQKDLEKKLWEDYNWTLRIPSDYVVLREYPNRNFIWLGRALPYRWISISWAGGIKTEWLTANGLFNKREKIGKLYQEIRTEERFLGHKFVKLGDRDALRMYGLWYHEDKARGGPFVTYAFYDEHSNRTFVVDMMVFAPGEKSINYIRQMEIMTQTFRTTEQDDQS